jgi:RNA recognition motif-containing protein
LVGRKKFFQEAGEVIDLRMPVHEDDKRKGFGYVEFATIEAAQKVAFSVLFLMLVPC